MEVANLSTDLDGKTLGVELIYLFYAAYSIDEAVLKCFFVLAYAGDYSKACNYNSLVHVVIGLYKSKGSKKFIYLQSTTVLKYVRIEQTAAKIFVEQEPVDMDRCLYGPVLFGFHTLERAILRQCVVSARSRSGFLYYSYIPLPVIHHRNREQDAHAQVA